MRLPGTPGKIWLTELASQRFSRISASTVR